MSFVYYNPNPKRKQVIDCTVRAICKLEHLTWHEAFMDVVAECLVECDMPSSDSMWGRYLAKLGYTKHMLPNTCPDCYTVSEFAEEHPYGEYLLKTSGHVVAVSHGNYYDTWDSGNEVPIYYWRKEI